jgi:hypothetical protein
MTVPAIITIMKELVANPHLSNNLLNHITDSNTSGHHVKNPSAGMSKKATRKRKQSSISKL